MNYRKITDNAWRSATDAFAENAALFASVVKWTFIASAVGALVGGSTTLFLWALKEATALASGIPYQYLLLPLVFLVSRWLIGTFAPDAVGHGTEKVIEAIHRASGKIPLPVVPVKLIATILTLAFGGSAGKEGPCAQIGSALASGFSDLLRLKDSDRQKVVICGVSAGFASVFGTPVAGALFGVEVLFLGRILYDVLFPSFVAGVTGFHVAHALGAVALPQFSIASVPPLSELVFVEVILLGLWCGSVSFFLIEGLRIGHGFFAGFRRPALAALTGGALVASIGHFVSKDYLGLGLDIIDRGLAEQHLPIGGIFWKILTTSVTLGSGGSGGIVTPIFFIGTEAGNIFSRILMTDYVGFCSAIGFVAVLAGCANTPVSASVMAIELFGAALSPHAALACMVSYLIVGHRSVYPSQILAISKSGSIDITTGSALGELKKSRVNLVLWKERQIKKEKAEQAESGNIRGSNNG